MLPSSVSMPVADTTARPVPVATLVPANTMLGISVRPSSAARSTASALRRTGIDSPVSVELFVRSSNSSTRRPSAEIRSPSERSTRSPGTNSSANRRCSEPSRMTRAWAGSNFLRASVARSALYSCQKENTALMTMTPITATPSCGISATNAMPAAAQRSRAITLVKLASSLTTIGVLRASRRMFGPYCCSRRAASSLVRPSGLLPRAS